jgi:hypothetical protein
MGFQVDLKEFNEVLAKLQKDTSKTNDQLDQAKNALNGIIQADAMQGETGKAIVNDINNNQNTVVIGLKDTNELLSIEMAQTLQDFQSTTGESDENAVILEDALLQAQNKLSNLQPKKHELDSRISNIYNSVSDLISLSMPNSQFDEKLVAASKELEDTIQKVQQFESKKAESNAENILNALNNQVQMAREMSSLSYTDPKLQAFFAQDALAKGIHEMDTQITKAEKEAKLQAEREMEKKREEWANHHPIEAWLQNFSDGVGEKWDVLRKGTKWVGENIPFLKGLSDDALMLEGFIGAAGSAISGIAIGVSKIGSLVFNLAALGWNSATGHETAQWRMDDLNATWQGVKKFGEYALVVAGTSNPVFNYLMNNKALTDKVPILNDLAQTFRTDQKQIFTMGANYLKNILTDPYALGGAAFDIISCFVGVGEVTAAVKGGKLAEGAKAFQIAEKSDKIGSKLEEVTALMNKLPDSMKNVVEKIKNIEIPNLFHEPLLAGVGNGGGRNALGGELFSVAKSETKGQAQNANRLSGEGASEVDKLSRIDDLRSKYGKLTSEQLNERINLRGETANELEKLRASGISNKKIGPAFAGVYDKTTGKYYYALNDFNGIRPSFHPTIQSKYDLMPQEVLDSYQFTKGAGSHAEVIALNEALKANPNASLDNFVVHVIRTGQNKTKPAGMMFIRCPHCAYLTDGFEFISEVPKNVE